MHACHDSCSHGQGLGALLRALLSLPVKPVKLGAAGDPTLELHTATSTTACAVLPRRSTCGCRRWRPPAGCRASTLWTRAAQTSRARQMSSPTGTTLAGSSTTRRGQPCCLFRRVGAERVWLVWVGKWCTVSGIAGSWHVIPRQVVRASTAACVGQLQRDARCFASQEWRLMLQGATGTSSSPMLCEGELHFYPCGNRILGSNGSNGRPYSTAPCPPNSRVSPGIFAGPACRRACTAALYVCR